MHAPRPVPSWLRLGAGLMLAAAPVTAALPPPCPPASPRRAVATGPRARPPRWPSRPTAASSSASRAARCASSRTARSSPTPFVTLTVDATGERGLLGVAFDPDFADQPVRLRLLHRPRRPRRTTASAASPPAATSRRRAARCSSSISTNLSGATNHNGGRHPLRPRRQALRRGRRERERRQRADAGEPAGQDAAHQRATARIPADNPFFGTATGNNRAIWALGLRNPFTFAFQPGTGRMFINDVGQDTWEEINDGIAGANYGWPTTEGADDEPAASRSPLYAYQHGAGSPQGCAITGGAFYNPAAGARSPPPTSATTSSPTTAAAGSGGTTPATRPPAPPPSSPPASPAPST